MKETFVTFSRLGTTKAASASFENLIKNIIAKIGQSSVITDVSFDIQINRLSIQVNEKQKKASVVPQVKTKVENGSTTIIVEPLTPSDSMELLHCFEQVKQYIEYIHDHYPNAQIHYMDVLNNRLDITFNEKIDFTNALIKKNKSSAAEQLSDDFDLFSFTDIEQEGSNESKEVPEKEEKEQPEESKEEKSEDSTDTLEKLNSLSVEEQTKEMVEKPSKDESKNDQAEDKGEERADDPQESPALSVSSPNKLMIVDGNNILMRSYFATAYGIDEEELPKDHEGRFINAIYVFLQSLERYLKDYKPTHLAICWDNNNPFLENFRKKLYSRYKETRNEKPQPLIEQLETIIEWLGQMNIAQFMDEKGLYEADDIIGTLVEKWRSSDSGTIYIVSNDHDLYQLLDTNINQILRKGQQEILYSINDFQKEYGIRPSQWIDVKAILGDKSDNIPGVSGVGEKHVYDMIKKYGSVENIYNQLDELRENPTYKRYVTKFESQKKEAELSKYLATIVKQARVDALQNLDIQDLTITNIDQHKKEEIYKRVGLYMKQKFS
jgi:5'-3' exonuclease